MPIQRAEKSCHEVVGNVSHNGNARQVTNKFNRNSCVFFLPWTSHKWTWHLPAEALSNTLHNTTSVVTHAVVLSHIQRRYAHSARQQIRVVRPTSYEKCSWIKVHTFLISFNHGTNETCILLIAWTLGSANSVFFSVLWSSVWQQYNRTRKMLITISEKINADFRSKSDKFWFPVKHAGRTPGK